MSSPELCQRTSETTDIKLSVRGIVILLENLPDDIDETSRIKAVRGMYKQPGVELYLQMKTVQLIVTNLQQNGSCENLLAELAKSNPEYPIIWDQMNGFSN